MFAQAASPEIGSATVPGVVLDTNVVLDWLVFANPRVAPLMRDLSAGRLRWFSCPAMRDELARLLVHRRLARWSPDAASALARFDALAQPCDAPASAPRPLVCRDADDQVFVDLAIGQAARWLFTQDRDLLALARRARTQGLCIMPPQGWDSDLGP